MLNFDKDGKEKSDEELGVVGVAFWRGFLQRHNHILTTNKGHLFELNRSNWTLFQLQRYVC